MNASKNIATSVHELSVVLPAYNEEANIGRVVRQVIAHLDSTGIDYEILPVNDGSRDRTAEVLAALASELPRVRPQAHAHNRGYGAALRTGFAAASKRYLFFMDSDGQFDIRDLDRLLPLASEDAIVTGYRIDRRDPFLRRLYGRLFGGWLVRVMLGVYVADLNCAFKVIPRRVLDTIQLDASSTLINAELYGRAIRAGFAIREVGVRHYPREAGVQTGAQPTVVLRAFYDLARLRRRIISTPRRVDDGVHHEEHI